MSHTIPGTGKHTDRGRGTSTRGLGLNPPHVKHFCQVCKEKIKGHKNGFDAGGGLTVHIKASCRKKWNRLQRAIRAAEMRAHGFKVSASAELVNGAKPEVPVPLPAVTAEDKELLYTMVEDVAKRLDRIETWLSKVSSWFTSAIGAFVPETVFTPTPKPVVESEIKTPQEIARLAGFKPSRPSKSKYAHLTKEEQREQRVGRYAPRPRHCISDDGLTLADHIHSLLQGHLTDGVTPAQMFEWLTAKGIKAKNVASVNASMSILFKTGRARRLNRGRYVQI